MQNKSIRKLTLTAMFTALTAIFSQIQIPMQPVPINLAMLSVFLAGGLLGWKYGSVSMIVYVLLGLFGAPVFAEFSGGAAILFGRTGGYIFGYIAAAFLTGLLSNTNLLKARFMLPLSMTIALLSCYFLGTAWFMLITKTDLWQALVWCFFPFLIGDALKITVATILIPQIRKVAKTA